MSLNTMRESFKSSSKWVLGLLTVAMLALSYSGIGSIFGQRKDAQSVPAKAPTDVVATVNGQPITRQRYENDYNTAKQEQQMFNPAAFSVMSDGQVHGQALQQAIQEQEEVIAAQNAGVTATQSDFDKARASQLVGLRSQLGLPAGASVDDINTALSKVPTSATVADLFPDAALKNQILVQKYQAQLKTSAAPSSQDMVNFYKSVHTRHILVSNKTRPDAQAQNQAQQIIAKIKAGGDFVALAKQYSDDPGSKLKGGDDGFITENTQYVPEFLNAALALKTGETTPQPILSPQYGYFVIQALAVKENYPADYQKNMAKYQQQVAQSLQSKAEQAALAKVAATAKVDVKDPLLNAIWMFSHAPPAGQTRASVETAAVASLNKAAGSAGYSEKALIYALLASIARQHNDTKSEIASLNSALAATEDPQLRIMLGDAYKKSGNPTAALAQYAQASNNSFNDASVHMQLQQTYKSMNQPALALKEGKLMAQIAQQQQQSQPNFAPALGAGGAATAVQAGQPAPVRVAASKTTVKN